MLKKIDTQKTDDPNVFGEILREFIFVEPVGCYSCFELTKTFKPIPEGYDLRSQLEQVLGIHVLQEVEDGEYQEYRDAAHFYTNGWISVGWYWDGDGCLAIIEGKRAAVNNDCKKNYTWEFVDL